MVGCLEAVVAKTAACFDFLGCRVLPFFAVFFFVADVVVAVVEPSVDWAA